MTYLILGLVIFLGIHSLEIVSPGFRANAVATMGLRPWRALYSLLSLGGFVLICWGYGQARQEPVLLYTPPIWTRHLALLLMLPVFPMLFAAYLPGRIQRTLKHPMLIATKTWALAHLLANGMLADVLLFGGFLIWAVADRISLKRRTPRPVNGAPPAKYNDLMAIAAGLVVYVIFVFWLHARLIGVAPLPPM